jgi:hypothetical protein
MSARGEGIIQLENREVTVLFTNKALAAAERQMDKSVLAVAQGFANGDSGISDMANMLQAGMEAARRDMRTGGRPVSLNDAYDVLDDVGFADVATVVMEAVATVLSYSKEIEPTDADDDGDGRKKK